MNDKPRPSREVINQMINDHDGPLWEAIRTHALATVSVLEVYLGTDDVETRLDDALAHWDDLSPAAKGLFAANVSMPMRNLALIMMHVSKFNAEQQS